VRKDAKPSRALWIQTASTLTKRIYKLDFSCLAWGLRNGGFDEARKTGWIRPILLFSTSIFDPHTAPSVLKLETQTFGSRQPHPLQTNAPFRFFIFKLGVDK